MEFQGVLFAVRSMAVSRPFYETVLGRKVALDLGANLVFEGGPTLQEGFAGLVGFVGLLVPHAARFLVGTRHRDLILVSMLLGALLVTVCDLLGRVIFAPFELPVGILLSLLGGPFFLWLLFRQRGGRRL